MGGYTKNIAVIRGLKGGFSSDGGALTGLVKAERYGAVLKIEITFVNFAPLTEGRYVTAISDGNSTVIVENGKFEGESSLNTGNGFAALICYVNGRVEAIASAVSGNFYGAALTLKAEVEKAEGRGEAAIAAENGKTAEKKNIAQQKKERSPVYEDEAIAEVNYYEYAEADARGGAVCQNPQKEEIGRKPEQNEAAVGAVQEVAAPFAGGVFYDRMKGEIEGILGAYPHEKNLESLIEGSQWVKISYGDGKFYIFGVIKDGAKPQYICYGVPAKNNDAPPESMQGLASFIPVSATDGEHGFWVMYQDAATGASLHIDFS